MKRKLAEVHPTLLRSFVVAVIVVWALQDIALLVGYSVLLAYALLPVVRVIERLRLPGGRHPGPGLVAATVMLTLVGLVGWLCVLAIPRVASEAVYFAGNAPEVMTRLVDDLQSYAAEHGVGVWLDPVIESLRAQVPVLAERLRGSITGGLGGVMGGIGHVLFVAILPLLSFYLLADPVAVRASTLHFIPEEARAEILQLGTAVDLALRAYVRGQAVVCLVTGALVAGGLALIHHPAALLLGLLAGAAELLPYLGFLIAAGAIAFAGSGVSTFQVVIGVGLYVTLNWGIGTFITPRLMSRYLRMHPFVVTVSVLAGVKLFGPAGALIALPGAAVAQAIIGELVAARHAEDHAQPPA